jgi:hypothetical protein
MVNPGVFVTIVGAEPSVSRIYGGTNVRSRNGDF